MAAYLLDKVPFIGKHLSAKFNERAQAIAKAAPNFPVEIDNMIKAREEKFDELDAQSLMINKESKVVLTASVVALLCMNWPLQFVAAGIILYEASKRYKIDRDVMKNDAELDALKKKRTWLNNETAFQHMRKNKDAPPR